ncbi:MAG: phage portal protein [Clostridium sp.]|nr:phage portal protein [Clostridium sp.]
MAWWSRKKEKRADEAEVSTTLEDLLLQANLANDVVTREMALNIPTLSGCVDLIGNTIATLPIKLFKEENGKVEEVLEDNRLKLLNDETGDTLDAYQAKKAWIDDYLLKGNGYMYIKKDRNEISSLHYVKEENVSISFNSDPIFKNYSILVNGSSYKPYEFLKLLRNSRDGAEGTGIIESNPKVLSVAYNSLDYENILAKTGGNKKGFIKAAQKLTKDAIATLKEQWNKLYSKNSENCVVLNNGLDFHESSATSTEMQLNENKIANGKEICTILNIPHSLLTGEDKNSSSVYERFVKTAILPILTAIINAFNRDLLLEKEKGSFYFAFDIKELMKADIEARFKAYEIAIRNKLNTINEIRYEENYEPIEAFEDTIVLQLGDVLYNTKNNTIYTPNTNKTSDMKGGEETEN